MIHKLPAGHTITATVIDGTIGSISQIEDPTIGALFKSSVTFGGYYVERNFKTSNNVTVAVTPITFGLPLVAAGAPVDARKAELLIDPAGDDNAVQLYANEYGTGGNSISVTLVDPGAFDQALAVTVNGFDITVSLATGADPGAITSTAAEVVTAINASVKAAALVTASIGADVGMADDGSGVVTAMPQAFLALGAGTGIGTAAKGRVYINSTTGAEYTNTGTLAVPAWSASVTASAFGAVSSTVNAFSSLLFYSAGVPVDYTDGTPPATGEGTAQKGALCIDITNGFVYRNSGTLAQPAWTKLGDAA